MAQLDAQSQRAQTERESLTQNVVEVSCNQHAY